MIDIPPEVKAYRDLHFPSRADTNAVIDSLLARLESEHDRAEDLLADKDEMLDALGHMIEDTPAEEIRRLKAILHDTQEAWLYERGKREKLERDLFAEASKKVTKVCGSCKWWIADSTDIGGVCKYRCLPRGFSEACVLWHRSDSDSLDVSCDRKDAGSGNMDDQHPEPGCSQPERSPLPEVERYWTCPRDVDLTAEDVWAVADVTVNALEDDSENWWLLYEQEKHGRDYWMSCAQKAEAEVSEILDEGERWVTVSGGDLPRPIQIRLGIPKGRSRLAITGVRIGALNNEPEYEITTRMLQRMSLRRLTESIAAGLWGDEDSNLAHAWRGGPPDEYPDAETPAQLLAAKAQTLLVRGGRRGLDEATLRRTVKLYDEARAAGETQLLAVVAQQLDVHPATVWRRLQIAWKRFPELRPMEGKP